MKTLYIVRHAKSDKDNTNLEDIDRPLNSRGYSDAHFMGARLKETERVPELIVSSPAIRALTTALIFAREFGYDSKKIILEPLLYETGTKEYLQVINALNDACSSAMIFGHNSTITNLVNSLATPFTDHIPTCGVTGITYDAVSWNEISRGAGNLVLHDFPKNVVR
jgi:phosphohistidine phosphatase